VRTFPLCSLFQEGLPAPFLIRAPPQSESAALAISSCFPEVRSPYHPFVLLMSLFLVCLFLDASISFSSSCCFSLSHRGTSGAPSYGGRTPRGARLPYRPLLIGVFFFHSFRSNGFVHVRPTVSPSSLPPPRLFLPGLSCLRPWALPIGHDTCL